MKKPLISVVIPAYNHEKFIGAAIESVLNQSVEDFELIIVNDGSTDRTAEVINGYDDKRISYYHQENQDAYNTINRGMGMASGRFISILNSDDVYTTDRFEKILSFQKEHGSSAIITDVIPISDDGDVFDDPEFGWNVWRQKNREYYKKTGDIYSGFLKGNFMVTTSNLFMKTEAMEKVGRFCSLRYLHDYDYIFRLMLCFPDRVHYMYDDKLLYYRIHEGNTLGEAAILGREQDKKVIKKYMLEKIPAEYRKFVDAGSERLVELEQELFDVRTLLQPKKHAVGVRPAARELAKALKIYIRKKF